jgi:hypothetical protein
MSDLISREAAENLILSLPPAAFYPGSAVHIAEAIRALPAVQPDADSFADLIADARLEAAKAMKKFPQPNYVISKVAEEAGEVVKAAIHCAEGRETAESVRGEIKQVIAMLYRLWVEGDQVHGLTPLDPALIDNAGGDTAATLFGALAQGQKRLGADFEEAWSANVDSLYDNSPGKEKPMAQYRKKPVVVEAIQWFKIGDHPKVTPHSQKDGTGWIETLEGGHIVTPGDWIIKGVAGEIYPCKPDIFAMTYEPVTREEVVPVVPHANPTNQPDTAPAGLNAGRGADWQPIETAPKDRSSFIGYWQRQGRSDCEVKTWWCDIDERWESPFETASSDSEPTHWMPRPAPPATEGGA